MDQELKNAQHPCSSLSWIRFGHRTDRALLLHLAMLQVWIRPEAAKLKVELNA
jgi:hypothetical protein